MLEELFSFKGQYSGLRTFLVGLAVTLVSVFTITMVFVPFMATSGQSALIVACLLTVPMVIANVWIGIAAVTKRFRDLSPENVTAAWVIYIAASLVSAVSPAVGALVSIVWIIVIYFVPGQVNKSGKGLMTVKYD